MNDSDGGGSATKRKRTKAWTEQEDALVQSLVLQHGGHPGADASHIKWLSIGEMVPGRSGKQCRERWHNLLNPGVSKSSWSAEEDNLIVTCLRNFGTKWSDIAKHLPGRTDNAVKNRWYSTARRVERFKRSGAAKPFNSPSENKKNNNPLFAFCLSVHGKPGNGLFGDDTPGGGGGAGGAAAVSNQAVAAAAAAVNATAGSAHHHTVASTAASAVAVAAAAAAAAASSDSAVAAGVPASNWQLMQLMQHHNMVGPDGLPLQLGAYPAGLANVTVASAVDAVELNSAMQTPTRPTSRASHGARTATGSARSTTSHGDGNSSSSPYVNALSARRCITPPTMLALPNSPPVVGYHNLRGAAAEAAKKRAAGTKGNAASGGRGSALKKGDPMLSSGGASASSGGSSSSASAAHSDALPLAMRVDFVQSASEEARAMQFDAMSPQSAAMAKMLAVPQSAGGSGVAVGGSMMLSPSTHGSASTPSPQSGGTHGSLSPFSALSPFPLPPTPSKYESPPNTTSASSTTTSHATTSSHAASQHANSTTFPMPSPAAAAAAGHGLPPLPPTPAAYNNFLQSPLPTGRPQLMQNLSSLAGLGMPHGSGSALFSPGVMLDGTGGGAYSSSAAIGGGAAGAMPTPTLGSFSSFGLGMPSPYPGGAGSASYSAGMPLNSPALHSGLSGLAGAGLGAMGVGMQSPASSTFPGGAPLFLSRLSSNGPGAGAGGAGAGGAGNSLASVQAAFGAPPTPAPAAAPASGVSGGKRKPSLKLEVGAASTGSPVPSPSNATTNLRSTRHNKAALAEAEAAAAAAAAAAATKAMPSPRNSTPRAKKAKIEPAVV